MARLRIISWNLRTFATHEATDAALARIADVIISLQADIVCIQELQIGSGVSGRLGEIISDESMDEVFALLFVLKQKDQGSNWRSEFTGVDSGKSGHMRDAYAFFWKATPNPASGHPESITILREPEILRTVGKDMIVGRRPGMLTVMVRAGVNVFPLNLVSFHAPTEAPDAAIKVLAMLPEIGGDMPAGRGGVRSFPLPAVDTVVLGDFNYSMDWAGAAAVYNNLLTRYRACVSDPSLQQPRYVLTTYSPDSAAALRRVSAYDNIFVLLPHAAFTPALTFSSGDALDFILEDARKLGAAIGFSPPQSSAEAAWYVIHQDQYKVQHQRQGISDHLPVWAEFTVGAAQATARPAIQATASGPYCLFHAVFGARYFGEVIDIGAYRHRQEFADRLQRLSQLFPAQQVNRELRLALISSMLNFFSDEEDNVQARRLLGELEGNLVDPFTVSGQFTAQEHQLFTGIFSRYVAGIRSKYSLYETEAKLLALAWNIKVTLWRLTRGGYEKVELNAAGQGQEIQIFCAGRMFFRAA